MRLSAFILDLLILIVILAPCRDHKELWAGEAGAEHLYAATPDSSQADDDCSPLCTCSCCASVSLLIHMPVVNDIVPATDRKKFPLYIAPGYSAERSAVWQPPRIG